MNKKYQQLILWIFIIALAGVLFYAKQYQNEKEEKRKAQMIEEYPLLDEYKNVFMPIEGVVDDKELIEYLGYFTLTNGAKFKLGGGTGNYQVKPHSLVQFIQKGDSLFKAKDDIYVFVYRNKIEYEFKLREQVDVKPRKEKAKIKKETKYKEITRDELLKLDRFMFPPIELTDFPLFTDKLPKPEEETSVICDHFETNDFKIMSIKVTPAWEHGPRLVTYIMQYNRSTTYQLQIDKLYYLTGNEGEYHVTERVKRLED